RAPPSTLFPYTTLFRSSSTVACFSSRASITAAWETGSAALPASQNAEIRAAATSSTAAIHWIFEYLHIGIFLSFHGIPGPRQSRSEEHTSELQSRFDLV